MADALGVHIGYRGDKVPLTRSLSDSVTGSDGSVTAIDVPGSTGQESLNLYEDKPYAEASWTSLYSDDIDQYHSFPAMNNDGGCAAGTEAGLTGINGYTTYGRHIVANANTSAQQCSPDTNFVADGNPMFSLVSPGYDGTGQAMRIRIPSSSGEQTGASVLMPRGPSGQATWASVPSQRVAQFYRFHQRLSSGNNPSPGLTGDEGCKYWILHWVANHTLNGATDRSQWGVDRGNATTGPRWSSARITGPNRTMQPVGPFWKDLNDGSTWFEVTMMLLPNSYSNYSYTSGSNSNTEVYAGNGSTISRDGRIAMWIGINGTRYLILDYQQSKVNVIPTNTYNGVVASGAQGFNPWCYQADVDMIPTWYDTAYCQYPSTHNCRALPSGNYYDYDRFRVGTVAP